MWDIVIGALFNLHCPNEKKKSINRTKRKFSPSSQYVSSTLSQQEAIYSPKYCLISNMCPRTHVLTSHQCIMIPKQTAIDEPCTAYLSERRQPPTPLPPG
ncbi:hypothetical protein ATANTOWER_022120 [Ataeniobius toweri]|uniref:Uncharacterized protein n=1 Tax=Ataeniobius toweri TaxID=208326 RepID=A0ABU7BVZ0_9TELE|nr:hypothetical protein [Ataeniobius toweri]